MDENEKLCFIEGEIMVIISFVILSSNILTAYITIRKTYSSRELFPIKEKSPLLTIASIFSLSLSVTLYPLVLIINSFNESFSLFLANMIIIVNIDIGLLGFTFCIIAKTLRLSYAFHVKTKNI